MKNKNQNEKKRNRETEIEKEKEPRQTRPDETIRRKLLYCHHILRLKMDE